MELKWLEDFLHLCNSGNFRVSAADRFVSQPAFSRRIKSLETWLDAKLIDRSSYPVQPTNIGEKFKLVAEEIVDLAYKSKKDAKRRSSTSDATLCFGTLNTLAQFFLPEWIIKNKNQAGIETYTLRTDFRTVKEYLDGLEEKIIDFYICYEEQNSSVLIDKKRFPSMQLAVDYLVPVTKADTKGTPLTWLPNSKGESVNYLKHKDFGHLASIVARKIELHCSTINFKPVIESNITSALRSMAIEGEGMTWLPRKSVESEFKSGTLVRAGDKSYDIRLDIRIYRRATNTKKKVLYFWEYLEEILGETK